MAIVPKVIGYGTVKAARVWNAIARVSGEIEYIHPQFKVGAILKAGTEIIRIAAEDYLLQIQEAEANIRSATAKIEELIAKRKSLTSAIMIEQRALKLKEKQLARKRTLRDLEAIAQATFEEEENSVLVQRQKLQDIQTNLDLLPSQLSTQKQLKAVYKAQLLSAQLDLERTHITLPFDARIASANVEITQYVQVGNDMGSGDSTGTAEIEVQIPYQHFRHFLSTMVSGKRRGTIDGNTLSRLSNDFDLRAVVRLPLKNSPIKWFGQLVRINDTIDPKTRTVGAIINIDNPYGDDGVDRRPPLVKGIFVEAELQSKPLAERIIIPRSALHNDTVHIITEDNRLEIRNISIEFVQGDLAIISSGLKLGERIVVSDLNFVTAGMLLTAVEDKTLAAHVQAEATKEGAAR